MTGGAGAGHGCATRIARCWRSDEARPRTSAPSTAVCTGPATPPITCTSGSARANDGQPVPDSNFWRESKSGASQAAHRYVPCHAVGVVSEATPEGGAKAAVEAHAP